MSLVAVVLAKRQEEQMAGFDFGPERPRVAACLDCGRPIDTSGNGWKRKRCEPCARRAKIQRTTERRRAQVERARAALAARGIRV